eukprot:scaffold7412_cov123-Isochrysis_galbana.AAC.10
MGKMGQSRWPVWRGFSGMERGEQAFGGKGQWGEEQEKERLIWLVLNIGIGTPCTCIMYAVCPGSSTALQHGCMLHGCPRTFGFWFVASAVAGGGGRTWVDCWGKYDKASFDDNFMRRRIANRRTAAAVCTTG